MMGERSFGERDQQINNSRVPSEGYGRNTWLVRANAWHQRKPPSAATEPPYNAKVGQKKPTDYHYRRPEGSGQNCDLAETSDFQSRN